MRLTKYLLCAAFSVMICACSHEQEAAENTEPSYHIQASDLRKGGAPAEEYIAMQQKAVQQLREGRSKENPVSVLSQMGYFYLRTSDYVKALEYLQEADSASKVNEGHPGFGDAFMLGNLATLYHRFDLFEEAMETNQRAIEIAEKTRPALLPDLYRMRGTMALSTESTNDSVFFYIQKAIDLAKETIENPEDKKGFIHSAELCRACLIIENHEKFPDSIASQPAKIERLLKVYNEDNGTETFILGYSYWLLGNREKGIPLMEKAMKEFARQQWTESIYWGCEILMKVYAKDKRYDRLAQLYPKYKEMADSVAGTQKINSAIAADIRYRASTKERENRMLDMELTIARQRTIILIVLTLLAIMAVVITVSYSIRHNRIYRQKRQELLKYIEELQDSHQELNSRIETLVGEINTGKTENAASQLSPSLLKSDEEGKFRRLFETLYPNFIPALKQKSNKLTSNDEIMCMLIYMHQTNEEIAKCLGITRMSVNTARYRIRTRLGLTKEIDLADFICSIKGK